MKTTILLIAAALAGSAIQPAWSQDARDANAPSASVRGSVIDASTQRAVPRATVSLRNRDDNQFQGRTDPSGEFEFSDLDEGLYIVVVEADGYRTAIEVDVRVVLRKATVVDFQLVRGETIQESVVVTARGVEDAPATPATTVGLGREEIRRAPGTAGDVFRGLDTLPGVSATGEFAVFSVRGRSPRDNLILVDDIPFDKVIHFDQSIGEQEDIGGGGRFSIFAPNLIAGAEFRPGGWDAAYGGKNGSLLRLEVAEGNRDTPSFSGRLDISGVELNYDGPSYFAGNTSLLVSARRLDFGRVFETIDKEDIGDPELSDLIVKTVSELGDRDRLEILAIYSPEDYTRDVENVLASPDFEDTILATSEQDSSLLGLTWRRLAGNSAVLKNTLFVRNSDKTSVQGEAFPDAVTDPTPQTTPVREGILTLREDESEIGWRGDFSRVSAGGHTLTGGARLTQVTYDFGARLAGDWIRYVYDQNDARDDPDQRYIVLTPEKIDTDFDQSETRAAAYVDYAWNRGRLTLRPGLRYDYDGFSGDSLVSPRVAAGWRLDGRTRLSASAGAFYQTPRPLDLASDQANAGLANERSLQLVLGATRNVGDNIRLAAEVYYQDLDDLVVFGDRTDGAATNSGEGTASGIDLRVSRRMKNNWVGTVNYSFSRSKRDDNRGEGEYDSDYHRPHIFGVSGGWEPNDRWALSAKWKFASGRPADGFVINSDVFNDPDFLRFSRETTRPNADRLKDFHTLNVRVDYRRRFGRVSLIAFLDFINVYGRSNVDSLEFDERRGVNIEQGLDTFPTYGLKFEF